MRSERRELIIDYLERIECLFVQQHKKVGGDTRVGSHICRNNKILNFGLVTTVSSDTCTLIIFVTSRSSHQ